MFAAAGQVVATPYDVSWLTRNSGAGTGVDFYGWGAKPADGSPAPVGTYTLRFVFDKAGGDKDRAAPREIWNSPVVKVVRRPCRCPLVLDAGERAPRGNCPGEVRGPGRQTVRRSDVAEMPSRTV
ncbi:hypothetical protein [Streptomyces atratus]|uniref:Uncharacterized protein n=1 Tax=Streptomyces atratus TaxID=1893 RepID=A0A2Z5JM12_STRAR|nr:hypothetical protein [Streptomyces atratus]AXE81517.1 hypothetical protein C5746_36375 [Streptomyces atratus]